MRPLNGGRYSGPNRWPDGHNSDTELLVDAIIAILTAALTIIVVVLRHPFMTLGILILILVMSAVTGWP